MSFLFVGCAHYNLAKDGAELATAGNHWGATKKYFESLEKKPGYEKALDGLKLSALPAYKQKLEIAVQIPLKAAGESGGRQHPAVY